MLLLGPSWVYQGPLTLWGDWKRGGEEGGRGGSELTSQKNEVTSNIVRLGWMRAHLRALARGIPGVQASSVPSAPNNI
jgi:hypothetical protein